jgi:ABC-type Fe3+-hydroxamate transport system substrate-binding protein
MIEKVDQMGRCVWVPEQPERIISLVPSQTELLCDLGIEDRLVGLTKFCIHPTDLRKRKSVIGGTKDFKISKFRALKPDLIIGNKEENDQELIEELAKEFPVWLSDINTLDDALQMIIEIGGLVNREGEAESIVKELLRRFNSLSALNQGTCIYLIWNEPMMAVGPATFINEMLDKAGFQNLVQEERYPTLEEEDLSALTPDYLLLSSEPFPFKDKHMDKFRSLLPKAKICLVDGEMFSWYGSRLLKAPAYFQTIP